ncbi:SDR family NAD(P)-dependent oxidoreductase [Nordella sp. HKS 07]|uniref:SDR family NAD(P)-dependent oxidoreductase n=1 Tax=Nordella sp. HKS 07 TaxID=2712222 RepID=UPI0013E1EFC4|nr:SDR family NAD(P)-dependent oxidoreductase [Nordella sp. HKS 07]QIG51374.1 SDR family NAD(P)-dependent oxidoreductase [Nordella sp. HKS 07]
MIRFDGQVALVTGAGRGIGRAYAALLAERGATVIIQDIGAGSDGRGGDPAIAEAAARDLRRRGGLAFGESSGIDTRNECHSLVERIVAQHGRLDVLIHNAGWVGYQRIAELDEEFLDRMLVLGVKAPLWLAQPAWPQMKERNYGRILLTTSDRALYPQYVQPGLAAYAAAKIGAVGIANVLANEGTAHGIVVNAISPVAKTRMWGITDEPDELKPAEIAPGAIYLVSPECREGGWILRASNGQFHATRLLEADGVSYPRDLRAIRAASPEEVAQSWRRIAVVAVEGRAS